MWVDTWADSRKERVAESHPHGSLNYFHEIFLLGFLQSIILIWLVHSSCLVYLKILTCVNMNLLIKINFTKKVSG